MLQPCYSLILRCTDPGILGEVQPCYSLVLRCLDPGILGEVPVCYSPATAWSSGVYILGEAPFYTSNISI